MTHKAPETVCLCLPKPGINVFKTTRVYQSVVWGNDRLDLYTNKHKVSINREHTRYIEVFDHVNSLVKRFKNYGQDELPSVRDAKRTLKEYVNPHLKYPTVGDGNHIEVLDTSKTQFNQLFGDLTEVYKGDRVLLFLLPEPGFNKFMHFPEDRDEIWVCAGPGDRVARISVGNEPCRIMWGTRDIMIYGWTYTFNDKFKQWFMDHIVHENDVDPVKKVFSKVPISFLSQQ